MNSNNNLIHLVSAAVVTLAFLCPACYAQDYPTKPIRFIVPFAPGGSADLVARAIAGSLFESSGKAVVVDNRAGAGGNIGAQLVVRAAADGYTILLGTQSSQIIGPLMQSPPPFDPIADFAPIAPAVVIPLVLTAHPSVPATSVKELIQFAKSRPNQLAFASSGVATSTHLAGELFKRMAKIEMVHVPYKGGGAALIDLLAGNVQLMFGSFSTSLPYVKTGKLRALGVASARRSAAAPDMRTIAESGLPGFDFVQWLGILAPPHTPPSIVNRFNAEISRILRLPNITQRFLSLGLEPYIASPEEFSRFIKGELDTWAKVIREAHIRAE